jgi:hypothetical protein
VYNFGKEPDPDLNLDLDLELFLYQFFAYGTSMALHVDPHHFFQIGCGFAKMGSRFRICIITKPR